MIYGNKVRTWLILAVLNLNHQYVWSMEKSENDEFQTIGSNFMQLSFDSNKATSEQIKEIEEFSKKFNLEKQYTNISNLPLEANINRSPAIRLLSLDGGGTRGYMTMLYLCYLTRLTQKPIHELFDSISASSIGSLLAAAFGTKRDQNIINMQPAVNFNIPEDEALYSILEILKQPAPISDYYTPDDMLLVFQEDAKSIFSGGGYGIRGPAYHDTNLKNILKRYFGEMMLDQLAISTYITAHDMQSGKTVLYSSKSAQNNMDLNHSLVEVIRAAAAAPTYFAPHQIKGRTICDGGIDFNNPSMLGLCATAHEYNILPHQILCISIGTGYLNMNKSHDTYAGMGALGWKDQLLNRMFNGENLHFLTTSFYQSCLPKKDIENHYFRISPEIEETLFLADGTKPEFFRALEQITYQEICKLKHEFAHFGSLLITKNFDAPSLPVPQTPLVPRRNPANVNSSPKREDQGLQLVASEKKGKKKEGMRKRSQSYPI